MQSRGHPVGNKLGPTLGVLIPWFEDAYLATAMDGIAEAAREHGANLVGFVGGRPGSPQADEVASTLVYDLVSPERIDGLILLTGMLLQFEGKDWADKLCERYRPLPIVSVAVELEGVSSITVDNEVGLRRLLDHLIEVHQYRKIGFIRGPEQNPEAAERYRVYLDALARHGIAFDPQRVSPGLFDQGSGEAAVELLLDVRRVELDALVAANDSSALGALDALQRRGIPVPEALAVVGFDDIEGARISTPPLSTVRQPIRELGRQAALLLLDMLDGRTPPACTRLASEARIRESCGCAPRGFTPIAIGQSDRSAPFLVALARDREAIAAKVARSIDSLGPTSAYAERLLDALSADVEASSSAHFSQSLETILNETAARGEETWDWQRAISVLRAWVVPLLGKDESIRSLVEGLLFFARNLVSDRAQRTQGQKRLWAESRARSLNDLGRRLIEADDLAGVAESLRVGMRELLVSTCFVLLYDDPANPEAGARLVLAPETGRDDMGGPVSYHADGERLLPHRLLPEAHLGRLGPFALVAEPLGFAGEPLGLGLFECKTQQGAFYDDLRLQLSSALRRLEREAELARLHQASRARALELEQAYGTLQDNQERMILSENMAALGRLTAGMAHEMNTPLAAVRMALEELGKLTGEYRASLTDPAVTESDHREIAKEMRTSLELAESAARRVAEFVHAIRFQAPGSLPNERVRIDVIAVIADTLLLLGHALRKANCRVDLEPNGPRPFLVGSPGRLAQVLTNLITNAVHACKPKGGGIVTIRLAVAAGRVTLIVADCGIGIAPENLKKIFDPMFTTKPFGEGTGLGLSIVHNIVVSDFGGTIEVDSEVGRGTTFTLRFPALEGAAS